MRPTKTLPASYVHYGNLEPTKYRKAHLLALLLAIPLTLGIYTLLNKLADMLRVDNNPFTRTWNPSFDPRSIVGLLLVVVAVIAVHEFVHGLLLWLFIREPPSISVGFPGVGIETPEWYLPRNTLLTVGLAPLILLTFLGLVLLLTVPRNLIGTISIAITTNIVASYQDLAVAIYTFLLPESAFINPAHKHAAIYVKGTQAVEICEEKPNWKEQLWVFLEKTLFPKPR